MPTEKSLTVRRAHGISEDPAKAMSEFLEAIQQPEPHLVLAFNSPKISGEVLSRRLTEQYPEAVVIGCSSSGEIGPKGFSAGGVSGISIGSPKMRVSAHIVRDLHRFDSSRASDLAHEVSLAIQNAKGELEGGEAFGILLIDGLSIMEEHVLAQLHYRLPELPLVGGSAGDDLRFEKTTLYHQGNELSDAAILVVVVTHHKFKTFKTQHFVPGNEKLVITKADVERRVVYEINGETAARQYAMELGVDVSRLEPQAFSKYPVLLSIGGEYYIRSVQRVNEDESITFFCAIDEGLVLTIAQPLDLQENLKEAVDEIRVAIPEPEAILCFECVLRRLEILERNLESAVGEFMSSNKMIGFHTYGEQFDAIHINQTLTGVALGE